MATRDRTGLFLRYREEARALHRHPLPPDNPPNPENPPPATTADEPTTEDPPTPITMRATMEPDWLFAFNDLKGDMTELDKMLEQLAALYAQHLLPSFGHQDTTQLEYDIRIRSHRLTDLLHSVEHKVRSIAKNQSSDAAEKTIRQNLQKRFATPLQILSMSFRKRQKNYLEKLRQMRESYGDADDGLVSVPLHEHNSETTSETTPEALAAERPTSFTDMQLQSVQNSSALAEERKRELSRVATNINDLATLVKDIAALVVDQGTVLDRVDYNLEDVRETTSAATRQLQIADRYQSKRHALCCIIILATACGIMTLILIYKWTS